MKLLLKLVGIGLLAVILLLIPLIGLYAFTVQSTPQDKLFVIKQQLEKVTTLFSRVSPVSFGYYSLIRLQHRFQEANDLIDRNQDCSKSLDQFVEQTGNTFFDIQSISSATTRLNLSSQFQQTIQNAKTGLIYKADQLQIQLKNSSMKIKTFKATEFSAKDGKLIEIEKELPLEQIGQKDPSIEITIINIQKMNETAKKLDQFISH